MEFLCDSKYIILPVSRFAQKKSLEFYNNGELIYDLDFEIDYINPEFEFYINVERFNGMKIELKSVPEIDLSIKKSNVGYTNIDSYDVKYRPWFHFTVKSGWLNDPNGLVYINGQYHMFFQHNPVSCKWGNMHWGHAVSNDLLHWNELDCTLYPDELGTMYSGSAIVDKKNVTGLKVNDNDVILLFYTAAGGSSKLSKGKRFTQCLAYSTDNGSTFVKYDKNPIIGHIASCNRDPKVIYHSLSDTYIMALYLEDNKFALLSSKNMLDWNIIQEVNLKEERECPDFYPLALDGDDKNIKWVLSGASDRYAIGSFDGDTFKIETETQRLHFGSNSYASQTWSNINDNRCIRIAWNTFEIPSGQFNQSMTTPCEMSLKTISNIIYLCANPVRELELLHKNTISFKDIRISSAQAYKVDLNARHYDVNLKICDIEQTVFNINVFGMQINCNTIQNQLSINKSIAPLENISGVINLRILIDKTGVEIYINDGQAFVSSGFIMDYNINRMEIEATDKNITVEILKISEMKNIWKR